MRLTRGGQDTGGDDVAVHDSAENVHEDALHVLVRQDDFERSRDLLLARAAAHVEEVGGPSASVLDDVHRGHREAGTVHEAGDVPIKPDVVQRKLGRGDLTRVLFRLVAHGHDRGLPVERVVVEVEFRIEREQPAIGCDDEWVHLDLRAVALKEEPIHRAEKLRGLAEQLAFETERLREFARLKALQAEQRMHRLAHDFLRRMRGDFLDVHATLGAGDHDRRGGHAVKQDGEIQLARDVHRLGHEHLAHELPVWPGLMRDERLAEHLRCEIARLLRRPAHMHAALEAIRKSALAAPARMDLRLHDDLSAEPARRIHGLLRGEGDAPLGGRDAE